MPKPKKSSSNGFSSPNPASSQQMDSLAVLLHRIMNRIRQSLELSQILAMTVTEVRNFLGTDRVMVYRFDSDGSGEVVAESVRSNRLPSLRGQHFPAEDIPEEVRKLYLKTRLRSIADVDRQIIGLSPLDCSETGESLAKEDIYYRSIDTCHLEYLTAMGVKSSLVVPILQGNKLWGLLVSHHRLARRITEIELQVVQSIADQVSIAIAHATLLEATRTQARQEATINRVATLLHSMTEMQLQEALKQTVRALEGIGGRVYIVPQKLFVCGQQPLLSVTSRDERRKAHTKVESKDSPPLPVSESPQTPLEEHPDWQAWLDTEFQVNEGNEVLAIADLHKALLPLALLPTLLSAGIRGMLTIRLQYRQQFLGYLTIFRKAIDIEIFWAGRPDRDDERNLRPRQSFETWRELKQSQARPWTTSEIELAQALGNQFALAIHQYELYQQVQALNADLGKDIERRKQAEIEICALNAELERRVEERTTELQRANTDLLREISEHQQAKACLERLSHQNELILNSAGEGIYGINLSGKTTFVNPAAARMLGYEVEELINRNIYAVLKPSRSDGTPYPPQESPIHATLKSGQIYHVSEDIFWRRDGSSFPVEYVSTPIREQGAIVGAVVIFKDITERQIVERMKDEFISVVSHELRTPLTSIRSALGVLMSGRLNEQPAKSQRLLEIAFENSNRLVRLLDNILDLERMKSGKVTMEKRLCKAADLMAQAVEVMQAMAEKVEIRLLVTPTSIQLWVDSDRIIQTLTNLLSNAIKFSPPHTTVSLSATLQDEETALFEIRDRGRGIPDDKLETIFDRFQQVDASDSRHQGGTGLGLAICRSIVQQHGGEIWAQSILGEGSVFYFTLPINL
ncbi:GAF domain-containing protein [Candidatus Gracilibacteria bacterium]|nr:GAF domain-containing protein [Candidatus Gracilibacteria bacterium]NJM86704.1 GAF domain-containing protein [Hydrococcus sp. RU_2_2]NJP20891.1 GAF domain-containing protein [Hydrococcus sp. CRU_1_1]